jgi:hypothetical protein
MAATGIIDPDEALPYQGQPVVYEGDTDPRKPWNTRRTRPHDCLVRVVESGGFYVQETLLETNNEL